MLADVTMPEEVQGVFPPKLTLAMAYVPCQKWEEPLGGDEALCAGTVFPSLVKPFLMGKGGAEDARTVFGYNGKG